MAYHPKRPPLDPCPVEEVIGLIGGKWKARLILVLSLGPVAFASLKRSLPGISQQVLSTQLQALVDDDLVAREQFATGRGSSVYSLTPTGFGLLPVLETIAAWGEQRLSERGETWVRPVGTTTRTLS